MIYLWWCRKSLAETPGLVSLNIDPEEIFEISDFVSLSMQVYPEMSHFVLVNQSSKVIIVFRIDATWSRIFIAFACGVTSERIYWMRKIIPSHGGAGLVNLEIMIVRLCTACDKN